MYRKSGNAVLSAICPNRFPTSSASLSVTCIKRVRFAVPRGDSARCASSIDCPAAASSSSTDSSSQRSPRTVRSSSDCGTTAAIATPSLESPIARASSLPSSSAPRSWAIWIVPWGLPTSTPDPDTATCERPSGASLSPIGSPSLVLNHRTAPLRTPTATVPVSFSAAILSHGPGPNERFVLPCESRRRSSLSESTPRTRAGSATTSAIENPEGITKETACQPAPKPTLLHTAPSSSRAMSDSPSAAKRSERIRRTPSISPHRPPPVASSSSIWSLSSAIAIPLGPGRTANALTAPSTPKLDICSPSGTCHTWIAVTATAVGEPSRAASGTP